MQKLLASTTSIQRFEMGEPIFIDDGSFRRIAEAITSSECVSELKFLSCHFEHRNRTVQLQNILQNKRNLTSLCLHDCIFGEAFVPGDYISMLSRPDSLLRCFEFISRGLLDGQFPGVHFKNLLRAIEKSKLERFEIGTIHTHEQIQSLRQSIPQMKVIELKIGFISFHYDRDDEDEVDRETTKQALFHAVKNNFSLRSLKAELTGTDLFDNDDKQTLAFYVNRNESLDEWVDNPETVDQQKVWPEALSLAERAGPGALFRGLRSVLGRDYVSMPGKRKCKRTRDQLSS